MGNPSMCLAGIGIIDALQAVGFANYVSRRKVARPWRVVNVVRACDDHSIELCQVVSGHHRILAAAEQQNHKDGNTRRNVSFPHYSDDRIAKLKKGGILFSGNR